MKNASYLASTIAAFAVCFNADASPELARNWSDEAGELQQALQTIQAHTIPETLRFRLERFGRTATRLSRSGSEETPLPEDIGCIFRGMAEETSVQLSAYDTADTEADYIQVEDRLDKMLEDAVSVGEAAALVLEAGELIDIEVSSSVSGQCQGGDISEIHPPQLR